MVVKHVMKLSMAALLLFAGSALAQQEGPLNLQDCVDIALNRNSSVLNARRQVDVASSNVTAARAALLPSIDANFSSRRIRSQQERIDLNTGSLLAAGQYRNSHSAGIQFGQLLFDFGESFNTLKQRSAFEQAASYSYSTTEQTTIMEVHGAYFQLLKDMRLLEVQEEAVKQSEEQLRRSQSMYEIGSVAQADVYQAQTQLGNDRIELVNRKNAVRVSRANLNVVMGLDADAPLNIVDLDNIDAPVQPYELENVMRTALQNNPSLHRFRSEMRAASFGSRAAKANFLPSFFLSAAYSRDNEDFGQVYSDFDKNFIASIAVSARFNIFNGFADQARVSREAANYRIAEENLVNQERQIRQQVLEALLNLDAWREISTINESNLQSAQEDVRLAQERYRVGAATLLDVQVAQTNLTRAKATLVRARYDTRIAEAQLKASMGALK